MSDHVKIIECPRDAWQGLHAHIPSEMKAEYLRKLIDAGFTHIDAVSFVSPAAVPQMADSERVLELLGPQNDVEIIGIVVNEKGAERAIRTGTVRTLGFPHSISGEFLSRNQHQTIDSSLSKLQAIVSHADKSGLNVVAYISMAFGNPYGEPWSIAAVVESCERLRTLGVHEISLADTVGLATPDQITETLASVFPATEGIELGIHLHVRPDEAHVRIRAAYEAGCRRFDAALGGLGGCPFAQDALVGNLPTEILVDVLAECGAVLPSFDSLESLKQFGGEIATSFATPAQ